MRTHITMVPRETVEAILEATDEMMNVITDNIHKRVPKHKAFAVTKRAKEAREALAQALKEDSQ